MADHTVDRELGLPRIADDINKLKRQIPELRTVRLQGLSALQVKRTGEADSTGSPNLPMNPVGQRGAAGGGPIGRVC